MRQTDARPSSSEIGALSALLRELERPANVLSLLLAHASAVRAQTERLALVSAGDVEHVVARHSADSLLFALAREPMAGERWVDVGAGAGFPGIPLACAFPDTEFVLVEPQRKRAGFLELQAARLGLANVTVAPVKASALPPGFDVATARALAEPALALEALVRLVEPAGTALVAVGETAALPGGADEILLNRPGVDSPGRFFIIARPREGA